MKYISVNWNINTLMQIYIVLAVIIFLISFIYQWRNKEKFASNLFFSLWYALGLSIPSLLALRFDYERKKRTLKKRSERIPGQLTDDFQ